jgi:hypothetical protein
MNPQAERFVPQRITHIIIGLLLRVASVLEAMPTWHQQPHFSPIQNVAETGLVTILVIWTPQLLV